ncbi:MAG: hypothetical protein IKC46_01330 [Lachnospiraceae bacterium]|nr:hypothetical protein [Lachnospiraceae bacterium]
MLTLHPIFTSHMVFAANKPIRIFGAGCGSASLQFAGYCCTAESDADSWQIKLPPMPYGGPYTLTLVQNEQLLELTDIYVGEVYLLAGQSNMQFKLSESLTPPDTWESNDLMRLFSTRRLEAGDRFLPEDGWVRCTKEDAGDWSAIGYLTGMQISRQKGIAVGLITCYQGASVIESWVPKNTFDKAGIALSDEEKFCDHYYPEYTVWNSDGALYDQLCSQIVPFSLNAVLWYQGESDCSVAEGKVYAQELALLIDTWRDAFSDPQLFFAVVQIADNHEPHRAGWKLIQQAQLEIPALRDHVQTIICADVCEDYEIHPRTKDKLALRLADALMQQR